MERRAEASRPGDGILGGDPQEEIELLIVERVVVVEGVAEEREGLDEGAAPDDEFGASCRQQIDGGKFLEHPHGIGGAQDGDGGGQFDLPCHRGDGTKNHGRGRNRIVGPVMLADAEHVQTGLVGELRSCDDLGEPLLRGGRIAPSVR
jgi:hypothetical protein